MRINSISNITSANSIIETEKKSQVNFGDFLKDSINKVNELEMEVKNKDQLLAAGQIENIHDVMIAAQKADVAIQFTIEVKNKILDAYREIMRLQL